MLVAGMEYVANPHIRKIRLLRVVPGDSRPVCLPPLVDRSRRQLQPTVVAVGEGQDGEQKGIGAGESNGHECGLWFFERSVYECASGEISIFTFLALLYRIKKNTP